MKLLKVKRHFDAAHQLNGYRGLCSNLHGHRWEVVFYFSFEGLDPVGISVDFKKLKEGIDSCLPDHVCLNNIVPFNGDKNPTAENLISVISNHVRNLIPEIRHANPHLKSFYLEQVELFESPDCSIIEVTKGLF